MRILVRTSKTAIWGRRLALFAAAVLLVATALHVGGQIESPAYETSLVIGTATALLAFVLSIIAFIRLWISGDKGWGPATGAFLIGLLCLAPAAVAAVLVEIYPSTSDVTTALDDPPPLVRAEPNHPEIDPETVLESFPNLITRIYQIPPETLLSLAQDLVRANGWMVLQERMPTADDGRATVNALRYSLLGWENEIVFRVAARQIGAQIDLRAASLEPVLHDLGDNGRAIETFLLALDDRVSTYIQDNLAMTDEEPFAAVEGEVSDGAEAGAQ